MDLGRTLRTVRHLRASQWVGRARRGVLRTLDEHVPSWCHATLERGAAVELRSGLRPRWPRLEVGPGQPLAADLLAGRLCLLGQTDEVGPGQLPWSAPARSPLWAFQVQAFHFAHDALARGEHGWVRSAVDDWIRSNPAPARPAWEPYCIARRVPVWLRLLTEHPASADRARVRSLGRQVAALEQRLELDLRGNHLWEDAVALYLAGTLLEGGPTLRWRRKGRSLLHEALGEQLLPAGGHAERSAMYHAILLSGLLELAAALRATGGSDESVDEAIRRMAAWLALVVPESGRLPQLHDSAQGPAPRVASILEAASGLGYEARGPQDGLHVLDGWVVIRDAGHHLVLDAGAPLDHQPGHYHASALGLEWTVAGRPVVIDPGVAEYEADPHRAWARSTRAHGVLYLEGHDSAEVWGSFRVGRRPRVEVIEARPVDVPEGRAWRVVAEHDGYAHLPGSPRVRREVHHWGLDEARALLRIEDSLSTVAGPARSRLPLGPGGGDLTWRSWGLADAAALPARAAGIMGQWTPSSALEGSLEPGALSCGWWLGVGVDLADDEGPAVHLPRGTL